MGSYGKPIKGTIKVPKGGGYNVSNGTRYHPPAGGGGGKSGCPLSVLILIAPVAAVGMAIKEMVF